MFIKFKNCGHSEFFPPARSAHQRIMSGMCYKCRQKTLFAARITVESRRRLIVIVETEEEKNQRLHRLAKDELRPSRKVRG